MDLRRALLICGILASILYVGTDILAAIWYPEYHSFTSRAISELMANGAPTERLVDPLFMLYDVLMLGFGVGVWMSDDRRLTHITGSLLSAYGLIGLLGPTVFEMSLRGTRDDGTANARHIAITAVLVLLIFASVAFGSSLRRRPFQLYSLATIVVMLMFGGLASLAARGLDAGAPTPWFGITERINIGAFLGWVVALAFSLLRVQETSHIDAKGVRGADGPVGATR